MAFDGIVTAAAVRELHERLLMGSISKVAQPEKDELLLTLKVNRQQLRLRISANASAPVVCLQEDNALSPVTAPNFCMSLRKHIGGGRITRIFQPSTDIVPGSGEGLHEGLERIIIFAIEHLDEMGDLGTRYLICELMGKHSNIILTREDLTILDSIRHISHMTSSVREVLPGRTWFIPDAGHKANPAALCRDEEAFASVLWKNNTGEEDAASGSAAGRGAAGDFNADSSGISTEGESIYKKIYMNITGISPLVSGELLYRAGIDGDLPASVLSAEQRHALFTAFSGLMTEVLEGRFCPNLIYDGDRISEFSAVSLHSLEGGRLHAEQYDSISEVIRLFYERKDRQNRMRSKSEDIRHVLRTLTERASRKLDLLEKQYRDTEKRDTYRIWGELLNTYGYSLSGGEDQLTCQNYYDEGREIRIPLDRQLTAQENAKRYFDRYQKLKRTREAVSGQMEESRRMLEHLESIAASLSLCESEADLNELRREMAESGYIRKGTGSQKARREEKKSKPLHFVSSDGIDIYVGRNNYQNEELDFKLGEKNDWWFHAKNIPGSHVIARTGARELPDATCMEAAALAAYYSRAVAGRSDGVQARDNAAGGGKVEVDYVRLKELKRVPGAAPGFVIYHTNYSIIVEPKAEI